MDKLTDLFCVLLIIETLKVGVFVLFGYLFYHDLWR